MKRAFALILAAAGLGLAIPGAAASAAPSGARAYTTFPGRLYAVAAVSARDVWAVGLEPNNSLIVHWNGSSWSSSLIGSGYYLGVSATGSRDVWAVGGTNWFSPVQTLVSHWNGSSWKQVAAPDPSGGGYFNAVSALSPSNAWAVGQAAPGGPGVPAKTAPLIEHWNGRHWTIQNVRNPSGGGILAGVQALSPSNVWAVGWSDVNTPHPQTLIEHWNGKAWARVPSPDQGVGSDLNSVTVISSDNAWAVGEYYKADSSNWTLALHWNGKTWTRVPSQTPGADGGFKGVTATWTHNIWAVGIRNPSRCGNGGTQCKTLIEHWDSKRWTLVPSPNPPSGYLNTLLGVVAVSRSDVWAVGSTDFNSTLIMHWNGTAWS